MLECQNLVYGGNRPWKNLSSQNFSDSKPQLTAKRPFVVQKWPFKAPFSHLRLADIELEATSSYRQIKGPLLVFGCIENVNPAVAGKAILWPIYTHI